MTPDELSVIAARADRATAGPWSTDGREITVRYANVTRSLAGVYGLTGAIGVRSVANAEFIAAARADVPALVAEVRRLTEQQDSDRGAAVEACPCGPITKGSAGEHGQGRG